jgi:hypothetical protein
MMLNTTPNEIAVRFYDNKLFGTTYGKGLYRKAIYNGSIDIKNPSAKYVIDMYNYNDWALQAKSEVQAEVLSSITRTSDKVYSWLHRYNAATKEKTLVPGCCILDINTNEVQIVMTDEIADISNVWQLEARPCKPTNDGRKVPQLLATNSDLTVW